MLLIVLGWGGALTGIVGALLLALKKDYSKWGWLSFLASNGFWLAYSLASETTSLMVQTIAFTGTSLLGLWQWVLRPAIRYQMDRTSQE